MYYLAVLEGQKSEMSQLGFGELFVLFAGVFGRKPLLLFFPASSLHYILSTRVPSSSLKLINAISDLYFCPYIFSLTSTRQSPPYKEPFANTASTQTIWLYTLISRPLALVYIIICMIYCI